jgi:hypothetical protein
LLSADRSFSASYFANSVVSSTGSGVGIEQRLFGRLNFSANAHWNKVHYIATGYSFVGDRHDIQRTVGFHLSSPFIQQGLISLSYGHAVNKSTVPGYTFSSHQIAVEFSYRF